MRDGNTLPPAARQVSAASANPDGNTASVPGRNGRMVRLRTYLVVLVILILAPALLLGAATIWQLGVAYRRSEEAGLASTAQALATALDREVEIASAALSTLAASPSLASGDLAGFYPQAAAVGRAFGGWVGLLESDSRQVFNTLRPLGAELPRAQDQGFIGRALEAGQPVVSDLITSVNTGQPVISVVYPLPHATDGASTGGKRALALAFNPDRLSTLLARQRFDHEGGFALLTDGGSRVLARSAEQARFLSRAAPLWYVEATSNRDRGIVRGVTALAGHEAVFAFERLERAPSWVVAVTMPYAPYEGQWRGPAARFAVGAIVLLGLAAILAGLLARRLLRPLQALARDANRLLYGGVPTSSEPERIVEFEAMRQALWRSVSALRARGEAEGRARAAEETAAELRQAGRRRDLLVRELNHRVKNMLATVQSLASQTLRGTRNDPDRFVHDFSGRLRTLAQAHDLLTASDWEGADVGAVAAAALSPWRAEGRVAMAGPEHVTLNPYQAQALVLALHELATNAAKYGALSAPSGCVEVSWSVSQANERGQAPMLEVLWRERGGPLVQPPAQSGFGSRLLERGLPHQFKGEATLSFAPDGVEYRLKVPREAGDL
ncbi:sensor histidine kinase [Paracraurococcus lichenis]|uniref:histidine kinase n=1 Tax=Paracraurococcus lichenis TaxID=3064888 RepID=A0ABT9EA06_9PROT|nr:sensor histidine kinase [Paracraurococcus sp. LOR1-02]MDO9713013.1 sensor histidine kinase [Paracraurococcus sp. LOR1-02]